MIPSTPRINTMLLSAGHMLNDFYCNFLPILLPGSIFLPVPVILKTSYVSFLKRMYYNGLRTQERGLTLE